MILVRTLGGFFGGRRDEGIGFPKIEAAVAIPTDLVFFFFATGFFFTEVFLADVFRAAALLTVVFRAAALRTVPFFAAAFLETVFFAFFFFAVTVQTCLST